MPQALGLLILSFALTAFLIVPFIDFLYKLKFRRQKQKTLDAFAKSTPIFDKLHGWKAGTPIGGGVLIIGVTTFLTLWSYGFLSLEVNPWEVLILLFTFLSFGLLGFSDDVKKIFKSQNSNFFGLRLRYKLLLQIILALIIGATLYFKLGYDFINVRWFGAFQIGPLFILLSAFVIVAFTNAFNITDGLDGLASGLLMICLFSFWFLAATLLDPTLSIFIAVWLGSLIAFLYFNIFPARIWLGDVGSLAFGATLAVVGLLTGKIIALAVIGGVFVLEVGFSLAQLLAKKFLGRKVFAVSPLHLWLQNRGWEEPKIVMRAWLAGVMLAIFGLWIAGIK